MTTQQKLHHQRQIANAIQRGDKKYILTRSNQADKHSHLQAQVKVKYIDLPTPQVCGTMTQQRTYAMDKAFEILIGM